MTFMILHAYGGSNVKIGDDEVVAIMFVLTPYITIGRMNLSDPQNQYAITNNSWPNLLMQNFFVTFQIDVSSSVRGVV